MMKILSRFQVVVRWQFPPSGASQTVDCVRRRREQGGRESKEEVEIFWRSRELTRTHQES